MEAPGKAAAASGCFLPPSDKVRCCFVSALLSASVPLADHARFAAKRGRHFHLLSVTQRANDKTCRFIFF